MNKALLIGLQKFGTLFAYELTHFRLNKLPYTVNRHSRILVLGVSGYVI